MVSIALVYERAISVVRCVDLFDHAVHPAYNGTGVHAAFFLDDGQALLAPAVFCLIYLSEADGEEVLTDDFSGSDIVYNVVDNSVVDCVETVFVRVADLTCPVGRAEELIPVHCLIYFAVGICSGGAVGLELLVSHEVEPCPIENGLLGACGIGGNVDVVRFRKEAVAEAEAFPIELMLEEAVNAVQTAVLGSAFNDEIVTFEVILVSVIAEAFVIAELEDDLLCGIGGSAYCGKVSAARLGDEGDNLVARCIHRPIHVAAAGGIVFRRDYRVLGNVVASKSKLFYAVALVIGDVEKGGLAEIDGVCVLAYSRVETVGGLACDDDVLVAVGAEYVSVVLEIRHVETVHGVAAERKIHIVLERIAEAVGQPDGKFVRRA